MEADWEFEVGGNAPVIDACWLGFVDLQHSPERAVKLPEAAQFPALAAALARLNAVASPVWTSKCDMWPLIQPDQFDIDELDAPLGHGAHAIGCYVDLLPKNGPQWSIPDLAAGVCRLWCARLRVIPLRCCRVDLIIRRAFIRSNRMDLGVTAYLTACGPTQGEAQIVLQAALEAFVDALCGQSTLQ